MGKQEGIPVGIHFHNMHYKSNLSNLFADEVGHDDDNSCASDNNWKDRKNPELDLKNVVADVDIDNDQVDDLGNKDALYLNAGLADNEDTTDDGVQHKHENQHNHFCCPIKMKNNRTILELLIKITKYRTILEQTSRSYCQFRQ